MYSIIGKTSRDSNLQWTNARKLGIVPGTYRRLEGMWPLILYLGKGIWGKRGLPNSLHLPSWDSCQMSPILLHRWLIKAKRGKLRLASTSFITQARRYVVLLVHLPAAVLKPLHFLQIFLCKWDLMVPKKSFKCGEMSGFQFWVSNTSRVQF